MRLKDLPALNEFMQDASLNELDTTRNEIRDEARENILKIQQENRRNFNSKRKPSPIYKVDDLVAIKRTQFGSRLKLKAKYLGPYKDLRKLNHDRYEVVTLGKHEGPGCTSTVAEFMKPWRPSFGTNAKSGRPDVGTDNTDLTKHGNTTPDRKATRTGRSY